MAEPAARPFTAFNFGVEIHVEGVAVQVVDAAFAECDGLEMTMDVKTIREGGNNGKEIRLTGGFKYGQVTMKRGMTSNFELWDWFNLTLVNPSLRGEAQVVLYANDGETVRARFLLSRCIPVKLKSPPLNAKDGGVAIEELQLAYETLTMKKP